MSASAIAGQALAEQAGERNGDFAPPNVVLIICDDLNGAIGGYNQLPRARTPNLDRLRSESVTFTNAHCNSALCLPSRNSMLSGLHPKTTGHMTLWDDWENAVEIHTTEADYRTPPLLREAVMLPKHFKDNGYIASGVGKVHHRGAGKKEWWTRFGHGQDYGPLVTGDKLVPPAAGFFDGEPLASYVRRYAGVDRFFLTSEGELRFDSYRIGSLPEVFGPANENLRYWRFGPYRYESDQDRDPLPDEMTTEWARSFLREQHDAPFFLAVGYIKPHTPLNVPQRFFDMHPLDSIELPPLHVNDLADCAWALVQHRPWGHLQYEMYMQGGEALLRRWIQSYLACVAFVDEQIGLVVEELKKSPYYKDTVIVVTSDHGYHMGEKGYLFKDSLWNESTRVPLIIRDPASPMPGESTNKPVSLVDLYPTLIELCGLPQNPNATSHGHPLEGSSFLPLLRGQDATGGEQRLALTSVRGDTGIHHSVVSERYRYTLCQNGEEELYDHEFDPREWRNLASDPDYEEVRRELRQSLLILLYNE